MFDSVLLPSPWPALLAFPLLPVFEPPGPRRAFALVLLAPKLLITLWLGLHPVEELNDALWLPSLVWKVPSRP